MKISRHLSLQFEYKTDKTLMEPIYDGCGVIVYSVCAENTGKH